MRPVFECDLADGVGAVVDGVESDSDVMAKEGVVWGAGSVTNVSLTYA